MAADGVCTTLGLRRISHARIPEVAEVLNVSRSKVYKLMKEGALPSVHIDRTRLVRETDLHTYVASLAVSV